MDTRPEFYNILEDSEYVFILMAATEETAVVPFLTREMFKSRISGSDYYRGNSYGPEYKFIKKQALLNSLNKEGSLIKPTAITRVIKNPALLQYGNYIYSNKYRITGNRVVHSERKVENEYRKEALIKEHNEKMEAKAAKHLALQLELISEDSAKQFIKLLQKCLRPHDLVLVPYYFYSLKEVKKLIRSFSTYSKIVSVSELKEANAKYKYLPPKGLLTYTRLWSNKTKRNQFLNNR